MTDITLKHPLEVEVHINESLSKTYTHDSTSYVPDSVNDTAVLTYTLNETSYTPSTFNQIFEQTLTGLTIDGKIDIILKDGNGGNIRTINDVGINIEK